MASVIRGSDNFDSLVHQGIGVNQTWQDVTSARSSGVTYTNSTGKPIYACASFNTGTNTLNYANFYINNLLVDSSANQGYSTYPVSVGGIVPNGSTYKFSNGGNTYISFYELK